MLEIYSIRRRFRYVFLLSLLASGPPCLLVLIFTFPFFSTLVWVLSL